MAQSKADDLTASQFTLDIDGINAQVDVIEFVGSEGISELFKFDIRFKSEELNILPADAVGKDARFLIHHSEREKLITGIITRFEAIGVHDELGIYNVTLSSELYRLDQIHQSRIFQGVGIRDIIIDVLESAGLTSDYYSYEVDQAFETMEYCVQYRESDLNFLNRICQRFGIFYYHKFSFDSGTKLIFADDSGKLGAFDNDPAILFLSPDGLSSAQDHVADFRVAHTLLTTKFTSRDYNFKTPQLDMTKEAESEKSENLEWYDYPVKAKTQDQAGDHSKLRQESEDCLRFSGSGQSDSIRIIPGYTFELENHNVAELNDNYLVTSMTHQGTVPSLRQQTAEQPGYTNFFTHQLANIPYRSEFKAYQPRINGSQTATVTGPDGHEIYSDEFGRVKVHFHWDRINEPNENSSCWVRVAQAWAGKGWGGMFIPRIGQEVIVDFLEGDPDKPIITGCVYNGENMPPYTLPDDQTKSTIRSESSLGGDGFNEFRFEDAAGSEEIYLHAQKDYNLETLNNKSESVGGSESQKVSKSRTRNVGGDESIKVGGNRSHSVEKDESITIKDNRTLSIGKNSDFTIGKNSTLTIGDTATTDIGKDSSTKIGKSYNIEIGDAYNLKVGKDWGADVGDKIMYNAGKLIMFESGNALTLKCGSASIVLNKNGQIQLKGKNISIKGSGNITIKGSKITQN